MRRVLIFLKDPQPGTVKTRLAATLGDDAASALYQACIELTLERLQAFRQDAVLYVDPPEALERLAAWVGPSWSLRPQRGAALGERLAAAAQQSFAEGARRVVIIGTDAPWMRPEQIREAFARLDTCDGVVGPTEDGGYYLVGLSRLAPALFSGIAWSSPRVFAQTMAKAHALGLRLHVLPRGYDLDAFNDVQRFVDEEARRGVVPEPVQRMATLAGVAVPSALVLRQH